MYRWICIFCLTAFLILASFFPMIASTSWGRNILAHRLEKKTFGSIRIDRMSLSWLGPQIAQEVSWKTDWGEARAERLSKQAPLWDLFRRRGSLRAEKLHWKDTFGCDELFSFFEIAFPCPGKDSFTLKGQTKCRPFEAQGTWKDEKNFRVEGKVLRIPSSCADALFIHKPLMAFISPSFDLEGHAHIKNQEGFLEVMLRTDSFHTQINALIENRTLLLKDPVQVVLPEDFLCRQTMTSPFLQNLRSQSPLSITIFPEEFAVPLSSLWDRWKVQGRIEAVKLYGPADPWLASLWDLLKRPDFLDLPEMQIWMAPCSFRIHEGQVQIERFDALLCQTLHLCAWGEIDLETTRIQGSIGLPSDTLNRFFALKALPEAYVLKIPVTGTLLHPDIDTKNAAFKIGALLAAQKRMGKLHFIPRNPQAPPALRPFPWERPCPSL